MSEAQMLSLKSELVGKLEFYNKMLKTLTELDANIKLLEKKIQNEKSN